MVGDTLDADGDMKHRTYAEGRGVIKPHLSLDGTRYFALYLQSSNDETMNIFEYEFRIANGSSTHLIHFEDSEYSKPFDSRRDKFNEMYVIERPSRHRHTYIKTTPEIEKLLAYVLLRRWELNNLVFQLPYLLKDAHVISHKWRNVLESAQFILDNRTQEDFQLSL